MSPWGHTQQQQQQQVGLASPRGLAAEASRSLSPLGGSSRRAASRQPSLRQQLSGSVSGVRSPTLSRHVSFHAPEEPAAAAATDGAAAGQASSRSPFSDEAGVAEQSSAASGLAAVASHSRSLLESECQAVVTLLLFMCASVK
jgi:hypothetical protein